MLNLQLTDKPLNCVYKRQMYGVYFTQNSLL